MKRLRKPAGIIALAVLSSCSFVAPDTTSVLAPVSDDLFLAVAADLERLLSFFGWALGLWGV